MTLFIVSFYYVHTEAPFNNPFRILNVYPTNNTLQYEFINNQIQPHQPLLLWSNEIRTVLYSNWREIFRISFEYNCTVWMWTIVFTQYRVVDRIQVLLAIQSYLLCLVVVLIFILFFVLCPLSFFVGKPQIWWAIFMWALLFFGGYAFLKFNCMKYALTMTIIKCA